MSRTRRSREAEKPYGIPLAIDNPTNLSVTAADSATGTQTYDYALIWKPTVLNGKSWSEDEIVIRVNDSLLFTVESDEEDYVELDVGDGDGLEYQGSASMKLPWQFAVAGQHKVTAWLNGDECGTLTVTVVEVDFRGPSPCEVGFTRTKSITVIPVETAKHLTPVSSDTPNGPEKSTVPCS